MLLHIAIVGAPSTGKNTLGQALVSELNHNNPVLKVTVVDDMSLLDAIGNFDLTLLTSHAPDAPQTHKFIHQQLRTVLAVNKLPYAVIYGEGHARTQSALDAIAHHLKQPAIRNDLNTVWRWICENCADAQCEHTLFTQLL